MNEDLLFNRELSWLSFNHRVLQEAKDPDVPLLERIKFLAIWSSNLDEFFRVRVASLRSLLALKKKQQQKLKFEPESLLKKIHLVVQKQQEEFGSIYRNTILKELKENNIFLINELELTPDQYSFVSDYFKNEVFPHLNPVLIAGKKISFFLKNKTIYLAVRLQPAIRNNGTKTKRSRYILLEVPTEVLPRFVVLPEVNNIKYVMFIDDVIRACLKEVFPGYDILEARSIKLTRDAELYIDDEFSGNLLEKIKKSLSKRKTGVPCRFLYDPSISKIFLKTLSNALSLSKSDLIAGARYHNFNDFFSFPDFNLNYLKYEPFAPLNCCEFQGKDSIFNVMAQRDVLVHYPYQKYDYVLRLLKEASEDESVKSIKITLYRTASNSKVIQYLIDAAKNGKSVTVFVEIKARFDEELNFQNADDLEKAGVKVLYSFPGLKVHAKICLISRLEGEKKKYYAYLSTGNFNEKTSRVYADLGFFTSDELITPELKKVFNFLSKKSSKEHFDHLLTAPFNLREGITNLINNEIANAKAGKKAYIILKLNSLEDKKIINHLYEASCAGVKIDIIVRGICCLVPGIKNKSSNIRVRSIVDRFLEHSRIYIFYNGGEQKFYFASADLMGRNLNRRIEICIPVYNKTLQKELKDIICFYLKDNVKARKINRSQSNPLVLSRAEQKVRVQYQIYQYLKDENEAEDFLPQAAGYNSI